MTYQLIYSSEATIPMQSDDLEALLEHARRKNASQGISGALIYSDGAFLQILEGERPTVAALMARIREDVRHEAVTVLREGDVPAATFSGWKMAYVSATRKQVATWAGINVEAGGDELVDAGEDRRRTARFVEDILALLASAKPAASGTAEDGGTDRGTH